MSPALLGLWFAIILCGIAAMQWGARRITALFGALRTHWGLAETAGGAMMGLATASPEISVNIASVLFGWPAIGLGTALGSNVPALPLIFAVSYASTRWHSEARREPDRPQVPHVKPQAAWVQAMPYLLVLALLAILTIPAGWQGLQPVDAAVLGLAFAVYFAQAVMRGRGKADGSDFPRRRAIGAALGVAAIAAGGVGSVIASRHVNQALGISDLVGGLFITGLLCALPESFAAWRLSRRGQGTAAISGAYADGTTSLTLALVPPSLAGAPLGNLPLFAVNIGFLALCLLGYVMMNSRVRGERITLAKVASYGLGYAVYLVAVAVILIRS